MRISSYFFKIVSLSLLCLQGSYAQDGKFVIDRVIATIGGEIVLYSEIQEQVAYAKQQQPNLPADFECIALQSILIEKMLVNQAKLDSVAVADVEVETQLSARIDRLLLYFNQDQRALEEYYGQTIEQIKSTLRNDMRNKLLSERMQGTITEKATITPAEVKAFFNKIPKDSLPYFNSEVEIREVVHKPKINEEEEAQAKAKADDLRRRIVEKGESFADLAKKHSADPGSGSNGGDLGWQKRGTFVAEFEATAYNLEKEQISPVIRTEFGYHIIQLIERRGNLIHCRHILIRPEITDADLVAAEQLLDSVRQLIIAGKMTFSEAVKRYGDPNHPSFNNDGRVANPRSGTTFFEVSDLDTDVYFAIEELKPGQVSEPLPLRSPTGEVYYRLVELVSRTAPHRASLKSDYGKIQQAALEEKKSTFTETWVDEKLRNTYLSIDERYLHCSILQEMLQLSAAQKP